MRPPAHSRLRCCGPWRIFLRGMRVRRARREPVTCPQPGEGGANRPAERRARSGRVCRALLAGESPPRPCGLFAHSGLSARACGRSCADYCQCLPGSDPMTESKPGCGPGPLIDHGEALSQAISAAPGQLMGLFHKVRPRWPTPSTRKMCLSAATDHAHAVTHAGAPCVRTVRCCCQVDANADGSVSWDEWVEYLRGFQARWIDRMKARPSPSCTARRDAHRIAVDESPVSSVFCSLAAIAFVRLRQVRRAHRRAVPRGARAAELRRVQRHDRTDPRTLPARSPPACCGARPRQRLCTYADSFVARGVRGPTAQRRWPTVVLF